MNTRCTPVVLAATAVALTTSLASAELLNVQPGFPSLFFNGTGQTTYDATTDVLTMNGRPIAIRFSPDENPRFVEPTGLEDERFVEIAAIIDETGALVSGVDGDDLRIVGEVDADGDGTIDFSDVLLTGEITGFGFLDLNLPEGAAASAALSRPMAREFRIFENIEPRWIRQQPKDLRRAIKNAAQQMAAATGTSTTDLFDLRFEVTGGSLAGLYGASDVGIVVTSEGSSFADDFTVNFGGGAKGITGPVCALDVVCLADPIEIPVEGSGSSGASHSGSSGSHSSSSGSSHSGSADFFSDGHSSSASGSSSHSGSSSSSSSSSSGSGDVIDALVIDFAAPDNCGPLTFDAVIEIGCDAIPVAAGTIVVLDCGTGCPGASSSGSSGSSHSASGSSSGSGSSSSCFSDSGSSHSSGSSGSHSGSGSTSGSHAPMCDWWYDGDILFIQADSALLMVTVTDEMGQTASCELELCDDPGEPAPSGSGSSGSSASSGSSSGSSSSSH